MTSTPPQTGQLLAGKYRLGEVLGEGGMGVVFSAWHVELDRRIAIKFLKPALAERRDVAERFRREVRATSKIKSEHVARVLDVGATASGSPFMVMEFLEGRDLAAELLARKRLPVAEAVSYIAQAIEAVAEAHAAGIVHRDLKPANLFLTRSDGGHFVKVLDFGISKSLMLSPVEQMSLTKTSTLIGSPAYMSPEQMRSAKAVDERTDIWALGAILYHLVAGQPPFRTDTVATLASALLNDTPEPLSRFRDDVPDGLQEIVGRCLEKDRRFRFTTVGQLAEALIPFGPPDVKEHAVRAVRMLAMVEVSVETSSELDPLLPLALESTLASAPALDSTLDRAPDAAARGVVDTLADGDPTRSGFTTIPDSAPAPFSLLDSQALRPERSPARATGASSAPLSETASLSETQPSVYAAREERKSDRARTERPASEAPEAREILPAASKPGGTERWLLLAALVLAGAGWLAYLLK